MRKCNWERRKGKKGGMGCGLGIHSLCCCDKSRNCRCTTAGGTWDHEVNHRICCHGMHLGTSSGAKCVVIGSNGEKKQVGEENCKTRRAMGGFTEGDKGKMFGEQNKKSGWIREWGNNCYLET